MSFENMNPPEEVQDPFDVHADAGISEEDRQDVLKRIDKITSQNKIDLTDDHFNLTGIKSGGGFPLLVNICSVVFLAVILVVLGVVFKGDERSLVRESVEYASIEGQLIRELRRESQTRISEKDKEINDIESRIQELEGERVSLIESSETRLEDRRSEYDQTLRNEMDAERQRLENQGVSRQEIDRLLSAYKAELETQFNSELNAYRQSLEEKRTEIETNLATLRNDYQQEIADLQSERQSLVSNFREQETSLRAQLEQRTRVFEESRTAAVEDLQSARQQLAQLEVQKQEVESIENQILGYYGRIEVAINRLAWDEALAAINSAVQYLNQNSVLASNVVSARRPVDLFVLSSLRGYVEAERTNREEFESVSSQLKFSAVLIAMPSVPRMRWTAIIRNRQSIFTIILWDFCLNSIPRIRHWLKTQLMNTTEYCWRNSKIAPTASPSCSGRLKTALKAETTMKPWVFMIKPWRLFPNWSRSMPI